ncbi:CHORISMATE SYNTHASE [Salix koriyanagi]|uniref:CHORISMATE SYNTHASE n=1 Tax=Salix koriyanagi TaxID=2511006 RepID=A0A9Q0YUB7_9ROSI|nr:CHORISMATE SYNTHASE [Salix koriyanagi]
MSLQSEDQLGLNQYLETSNEPQKKLKISYAREFLLSLSELDICKKLPSGFDESLPSEFKDILQDRFRIPVSSSSQSSRRNDYSSSPPTRGDSGNFFRGIHGRWDSRSSGRSDRDSDTQSDWDSAIYYCWAADQLLLFGKIEFVRWHTISKYDIVQMALPTTTGAVLEPSLFIDKPFLDNPEYILTTPSACSKEISGSCLWDVAQMWNCSLLTAKRIKPMFCVDLHNLSKL